MSEEDQIALAIEQSLRESSGASAAQSHDSAALSQSFDSGRERNEDRSTTRRSNSSSSSTTSQRSQSQSEEEEEEEKASNDVPAPANEIPSATDDEAFALALQRQFEEEASNAVMSRLEQQRARVLRRTNVDISAFLGYSPGSHFAISSSSSSSSSGSRTRSGWRVHSRMAHVDPDRMSYEELLELGERLGEVKKKGATASQIRNHTQLYTFKKVANNDAHTRCSVCISDFEEGEEVRMLPCIHAYHKDCIDKWLSQKINCPVCQRPITGSDS